jgi:hypothetical protein
MWLSGFGFAMVQLLIRIGAAACAGPLAAITAAKPTMVSAVKRPKEVIEIFLLNETK